MSFTAQELANIFNATLDNYLHKGQVFKQNVQNKPMLKAFDESAGTFSGGKGNISLAVKSGQGGGSLSGYTHDDVVGFHNPATTKRVNFPWKEHHIGLGITHTELKIDGITVIEDGADQNTSEKEGREEFALANLLDEKLDDFGEDYAVSLNSLIHGDGTADAKALAGIGSLLVEAPAAGTSTIGGLGQAANSWWANRAATAVNNSAGGQDAITSSTTGGGALLNFLQKEIRQLNRYAQGGVRRRNFAGSDFIDALEKETRANGYYSMTGFEKGPRSDMGDAKILGGVPVVYDPTLDDLGLSKRCYSIDMRRIRLYYMKGEKMKKTMPARPYDRYVMFRGITSTCVMGAQQLNTSGIYDIA